MMFVCRDLFRKIWLASNGIVFSGFEIEKITYTKMNHVQQAAIGNKIVFVFDVPHHHAQFVVDCSKIIPYLCVLS